MWLRDSLPNRFPSFRVLTYGYNSQLAKSESFQDHEAIASTFRSLLGGIRSHDIAKATFQSRTNRSQEPLAARKPIILIAHSLGGLVIKQVWPLPMCALCRFPILMDL
jgi:alpha-beta hydrolase superfamily lysophospholipase